MEQEWILINYVTLFSCLVRYNKEVLEIKLDHEQFLSAEVQSRSRAEEERLDCSKYREYSRRFVLCCFVITVKWSLLKQQDLDTVIITKVSMFTFIEQYFSVATRVLLSKVSL